jgi:Methyltransferase domain
MTTREETSVRLSGNFDQSAYGALLRHALTRALAIETKLPDWIFRMEGMSGRKYRTMVNELIGSLGDARYLEVGSWAGSTACSAICGNKVKVRCIDNWSEFGGPKGRFLDNIHKVTTPDLDFQFIESDFRQVDYSAIGRFNVYLFDGPHAEQDQFDGVMVAQPALDDHYILIVDDYNWQDVRDGTQRALRTLGVTVECAVEVRTTQDNAHPIQHQRENSDWHNGYYFAVCRR